MDKIEISKWSGSASGYKYVVVIEGKTDQELGKSMKDSMFDGTLSNYRKFSGSGSNSASGLLTPSYLCLYDPETCAEEDSKPEIKYELSNYRLITNVKKTEQQYQRKYVLILELQHKRRNRATSEGGRKSVTAKVSTYIQGIMSSNLAASQPLL